MKKVYFVHYDRTMRERQSDGVEFCLIPEFYDNKIYFYCNEFMIFWETIYEAGDSDKCCDFKVRNGIKPATLEEICNEGLVGYVDSVKEYTVNNKSLSGVRYIHLNEYNE